jgi:hypothetical protein
MTRLTAVCLRAFAVCTALLAVALAGGAARSMASTTPRCSQPDPTGRQFCVTIEDQEGVSPSGTFGTGKRQVDVTAYQYYRLTFENKGGSTLTNGTLTVSLTDHVVTQTGTSDVASTASFDAAASAPFCSASSGVVTCSLGNIPASSQKAPFYLVYRTSTTPGVASTTLSGTAAFKEGANGPNGANPATLDVTEGTSLEIDPEESVAWSPPAAHVVMATNPTYDAQFSKLQYDVPAGKPGFAASASEGSGSLCAAGLTCFGEVVTTDLSGSAAGTFSATNLFHLTITISLDAVPGGNTSNVVLVHRRDDGLTEVVSTQCSGSPPTSSDRLPCIVVTRDNKAKLLIIDAWGFLNGGWVPGL